VPRSSDSPFGARNSSGVSRSGCASSPAGTPVGPSPFLLSGYCDRDARSTTMVFRPRRSWRQAHRAFQRQEVCIGAAVPRASKLKERPASDETRAPLDAEGGTTLKAQTAMAVAVCWRSYGDAIAPPPLAPHGCLGVHVLWHESPAILRHIACAVLTPCSGKAYARSVGSRFIFARLVRRTKHGGCSQRWRSAVVFKVCCYGATGLIFSIKNFRRAGSSHCEVNRRFCILIGRDGATALVGPVFLHSRLRRLRL
jgi:hypothetical protein